ncbi:cell division protein FtsN [Candidatus Erwinia dacicola]|uniref:Cell division protein FtsN n=1 Tax=Candidatus Erwinia dacicola TaxID=252393 RepID=A0A1E7Z3K5_9GAMM|nr:cell division protein FtsN [Candidatus Erwinia dacicola]NJC99429.1 cell division protein FtsN [Candidatus Erwinia dacicola]NJD85570.1 cell division protein FtsN [Candidatus Erwinia dacicola]OFC63314.1 cell division protein FtsN [Candidatus Erwinia dacicola]RAP72342.1 cell division protein FtsN [Candidatus Erwinia dacicola]
MAQKDYVGRGRSTGTRRKKTDSRSKKRSSGSDVPKIMVVLAVAVLVTFIGGLWFIAHHKKEDVPVDMPVIPDHKATGNGLPPKPEERWRYIKELENRQLGVPTPTEPTSGGEAHSQTQLTDEQRHLLDQMQADMRHQPTQLNEVPWNEQIPAQRQQQTQLQQQSRMPQQPVRTQPQQAQQPAAPITPVTHGPVRQQLKQETTAAAPKVETKPKKAEKINGQRWMVQCGSFKGTEQAQSIRAQLAFEGFESRITTGGGWNRVVMGPYNNRSGVDSTLKRLRGSGHSNCIPLSVGVETL